MTDIMTPIQRHRCMSHIRSRNTKPEIKVRQWLWRHGYRYRLCVKGVPGKPDIVMRKYRTAIFVNGCFWHGHGVQLTVDSLQLTVENSDSGVAVGKVGEKGIPYKVDRKKVENSECCRIPQSNTDFWIRKIQRNQERDQQNYRILRENGWQVIVLWECQLKPKQLEQTMLRVEVQLHDYYLATFNPKDKSYIRVEEELPMAAEDMAEYNV
jgi:DNA mismatch endonuclease (patch repair protein)